MTAGQAAIEADGWVKQDGSGARDPARVLLPMALLLGFTVVITAVTARLFRWDDS